MADEMMLMFNDDGVAHVYDETYDIVIHCESAEEQKKVEKRLMEMSWIPCSERLPEDDTLMLVNYIYSRPDAGDIWIGWHEMENVWYIDGEAHSSEFGNEVIAWMPLPEPWMGEEE